ncbi:MAG: GntR family transcriptional regulator [Candidatus Solibacter sp.]
MVPFRLTIQPGVPVGEQVVFAAKKAMFSGKLRPGDPFPSVRELGRAMKIHSNTAQKVIAQLTAEGLLVVRPGIGTVVASPPLARGARGRLLAREIEQLTVQALQVGLTPEELQAAIAECWRSLKKEHGQ